MEEYDFESDITINPDELDIAALEQSNLAMKYSRLTADAERAAKKAHEKVKVLRSQLVKDVSNDPERLLGKGQKATGVLIEAYYRDHPDYKAAKKELVEAEYQRDIMKAASDHVAFQRKKMIEILAQLLQAEYFSSPSVPRDLSTEWKKRKSESIENTVAKVTPRRKRV